MKTERNILMAFILNFGFSVFEFFGGIFTGSVAIMSDAVHDAGDALSIGLSYVLERVSRKKADKRYTFGYTRYSVLSSVITTMMLIAGSIVVIYNAICRMISPVDIHYNGMIIFAVIGIIVNLSAAYFTHGEGSLNQKAVNLHMLEDVLSWIVVLVGAIIMRLTGFALLDSIMSLGVAIFIVINAVRNLKKALDVFLMKTPEGIDIDEIKHHILEIDGVEDVHHIHVFSIDGYNNSAAMHIVSDADSHKLKDEIKEELREHGIVHATLELERSGEHCHDKECHLEKAEVSAHSHHHHHH